MSITKNKNTSKIKKLYNKNMLHKKTTAIVT